MRRISRYDFSILSVVIFKCFRFQVSMIDLKNVQKNEKIGSEAAGAE